MNRSGRKEDKVETRPGLDFQASLALLEERLATHRAVPLLSALVLFGLATVDGEDPEQRDDEPLLQSHVELIQALALRREESSSQQNGVWAGDLAEFKKLARNCSIAFQNSRLSTYSKPKDSRDFLRLIAIEQMRFETQVIRNWGYRHQVIRIIKDLFEPLDPDLEREHRVTFTGVVEMLDSLTKWVDTSLTADHQALSVLFQLDDLKQMADSFHRRFPEFDSENVVRLEDIIDKRSPSREDFKGLLFNLYSLVLARHFTFSLEDFQRFYPNNVSLLFLAFVLDRWSLSFGDLKNEKLEHLFLNNPVWQKPIIHFHRREFFWPILGLFISHCTELLEALFSENKELTAKYEKRRAKYLEAEVERLLREALPSATFWPGLIWHDPVEDKLYENDLLLAIDGHFLVIEAKSGKLLDVARRGGSESLTDNLNDLVVAPAVQSQRFAMFLECNRSVHRLEDQDQRIHVVDTSGLRSVSRLSVTLEQLGMLSAEWPRLREAGFISEDVQLAPTMSVAQLETVLDVLDSESERLHYLRQRAVFEESQPYFAEELDLLAHYVERGFPIADRSEGQAPLLLYGRSQVLHPFVTQEYYGKQVPRPSRPFAPFWKTMLHRLETEHEPGWIELSDVLLRFSIDEQEAVEKGLKTILRVAKGRRPLRGRRNTVVVPTGPSNRRAAIAIYAYRREDLVSCDLAGPGDEVHAMAEMLVRIGQVATAETQAQEILIVTACVDQKPPVFSLKFHSNI
jgi:hypothetical protein